MTKLNKWLEAMDEKTKVPAGLERHLIAVLTAVVIALILWVGSGVQQTQVKLAAMEVELQYIKNNTDKDDGKFHEIEKRLDAIERALHNHDIANKKRD